MDELVLGYCICPAKLPQKKSRENYGLCLAGEITGDFFFLIKKKNQERKRFKNGVEGYSPSSSSGTHNPYFDDFIFYNPPKNALKCFTFYPHPHKSLLLQTDKSEGEKHSSRFSETLLLFSSL